jgi:hypothetical protein
MRLIALDVRGMGLITEAGRLAKTLAVKTLPYRLGAPVFFLLNDAVTYLLDL